MSQLSADTQIVYELGDRNSVPVLTAIIIYKGSAVGYSSGYGRQLVAGDKFAGFALEGADNTDGSSGDININVQTSGLAKLAVGSVAVTDIGKPVYASDGATFTLTQSTNSKIGVVHRFVSTGVAIVKFDASDAGNLSGITSLTDNSAGTANDTLQALSDGSTYANDVAAIRNNFADLAAKVNEIIAAQK